MIVYGSRVSYHTGKLREQFAALPAEAQSQVRDLLPHREADILWAPDAIAKSDYDVENRLPYGHAINVYGTGTPSSGFASIWPKLS